MRIDCHTHAFSEKIAEKAVQQLINYYQLPTANNGTLTELICQSKEAKLDAVVLLVAATRADQVKPAHDWILSQIVTNSQTSPRLLPFGTYHPDDPNWLSEIDRLRDAGIHGLKLHPEFQQIDLADPRLLPFFEEIQSEFCLMVHVGDPTITSDNKSTPKKVARIAEQFPQLRIIAAHMGGYCMWEEAYEELAGRPVFLDISSTLDYIDPDLLHRIIDRHGVDRILFGSDYPLRSPLEDIERLEQITWLSTSDKEKILGENGRELFSL